VVGLKVTVIVADGFFLFTLKLVGEAEYGAVAFTLPMPVPVTVTDLGLLLPTETVPKSRLVGDVLITAHAGEPPSSNVPNKPSTNGRRSAGLIKASNLDGCERLRLR